MGAVALWWLGRRYVNETPEALFAGAGFLVAFFFIFLRWVQSQISLNGACSISPTVSGPWAGPRSADDGERRAEARRDTNYALLMTLPQNALMTLPQNALTGALKYVWAAQAPSRVRSRLGVTERCRARAKARVGVRAHGPPERLIQAFTIPASGARPCERAPALRLGPCSTAPLV